MSAGMPTPGGGAPAGLHVLRRPRRVPVPTERCARWLRVALLVVLLVLLGGAGLGLARAQETGEGVPRYSPSSRGGREAVRELAEQHFAPEWVGWAVKTAGCESSFDLYARSSGFDRVYGWYEHVGAWQVSVPVWSVKAWALFGGPLSDPAVGAAMAAWILAHQGPGAWPFCGSR